MENNAIVSKDSYYFGSMQLPAVEKNLMFTISATGKNANFGIQQYGLDNQRISIPMWKRAVNGSVELKFIIPAANLKKPSKLMFYSIGKKELSFTSFKVEFTDLAKVPAPKKAMVLPAVTVPFKSDFSKKQTGISIGGKAVGGKITVKGGYTFGTITIPATKDPLSCSLTMTVKDGATLGLVLYEVDNAGRAGKVLNRYAWGKRLGQAGEKLDLAIPAHNKQMFLMMYNVSKAGSIDLEGIEIGKME